MAFSDWSSAFGTIAETGCSCEPAAKILGEYGVTTRGPIVHDWIPGTSLYFEDPDGHELELFAPST